MVKTIGYINSSIEKDVPAETIKLVSEYLGTEQVTADDLIEVIHTNITDNKDNLDPMFYASLLMAYPEGWLRQQELFGEFADRGSVLGNPRWFDGKILKYVPTDIKARSHRSRYRRADFGFPAYKPPSGIENVVNLS